MARKPTLPRNTPNPEGRGQGVTTTSVRNLSALDRQMQALDLRKSGASFAQIAQALGYATPSGAHKAVMSAIKKTLREPAEEVRTLELERLDRLQMAAWTKAIKGDLRAIMASCQLGKQRLEALFQRFGIATTLAAFEALIADAEGLGANAVLAMRYDANEIASAVTEVLAYGTAVIVEEARATRHEA